jgi:hypothetical protein
MMLSGMRRMMMRIGGGIGTGRIWPVVVVRIRGMSIRSRMRI